MFYFDLDPKPNEKKICYVTRFNRVVIPAEPFEGVLGN